MINTIKTSCFSFLCHQLINSEKNKFEIVVKKKLVFIIFSNKIQSVRAGAYKPVVKMPKNVTREGGL